MEIFVVGKFKAQKDEGNVWEFIGVYDTEQRAIDACIKDEYFVGPAVLNSSLPDKTVDWPGCYYPRLQDKVA
jgi:hypothetical protein